MTDFENVLLCLLMPIAYVLTYIAGKYDLLNQIIEMLEENLKKEREEE